MKIHPVKVNVTYTSGRTEKLSFNEDWPSHQKSIEDAMKHGAVKSFYFWRACDTYWQKGGI